MDYLLNQSFLGCSSHTREGMVERKSPFWWRICKKPPGKKDSVGVTMLWPFEVWEDKKKTNTITENNWQQN